MAELRAVKVINRLKELGLTVKDFADGIGYGERAIYHWLSYEREPRLTFRQFAKACELLRWSAQELSDNYYADEETENVISAESEGDYATN